MRNASIDSPIDDLTYDVITVLRSKARALEAYESYIRDAVDDDEAREVFEEMRRQDQEHVRVLKEVLARRLDEDLGYLDEDADDDYAEEEGEEDAYAEPEIGEHRGEGGPHLGPPPPPRGTSTHRRGV